MLVVQLCLSPPAAVQPAAPQCSSALNCTTLWIFSLITERFGDAFPPPSLCCSIRAGSFEITRVTRTWTEHKNRLMCDACVSQRLTSAGETRKQRKEGEELSADFRVFEKWRVVVFGYEMSQPVRLRFDPPVAPLMSPRAPSSLFPPQLSEDILAMPLRSVQLQREEAGSPIEGEVFEEVQPSMMLCEGGGGGGVIEKCHSCLSAAWRPWHSEGAGPGAMTYG